jgi:hypothetical protein
VYPLYNFQDEDEGEDEEEEEEIEEKKPAGPPIGDLILKGADGRTFHASDATKMPEAVAARIAEYEKELNKIFCQCSCSQISKARSPEPFWILHAPLPLLSAQLFYFSFFPSIPAE